MPNSENKIDDDEGQQQLLRRITNIENRVDSLDQTIAFSLRADAPRQLETVKRIFGTSLRRVQVYLAADGKRSVGEIAKHLGMKVPNVSTFLTELQDEDLLTVKRRDGNNIFWGKKHVDKTLRISQYLMAEHDLDSSGLPNKT